MTALKSLGLAAAALMLLAGEAAAQKPVARPQAPIRAVYVTGQDGNPKIYYVTGTVPPEKLPTVVPAAPNAIPPIPALPPAAPKAAPVRSETRAAPEIVDTVPMGSASCPDGRCGSRCKHGLSSCWTCAWTPATVPAPLGASVRGVFDMQRDNALAEYFVVYREDWLDTRSLLNDTGVRHLDGIIRRIGMIGAPVKVEPSGSAELDQRRVVAIVEKLVQSGIPPAEAASRVVIGTTRAEGLRYTEIQGLYNRGPGGNNTGGGSSFGSGGGFGGLGGIGGLGGVGGFGGFR